MEKNRIKKIRLTDYDYKSNGYYFVTVVTKNRENLFNGRELDIERELKSTVSVLNGVSLDYFIIMPNHVHLILQFDSSKILLGEVVRRFKAKVSHMLGRNVWQPNYYEHIIRNEIALNTIREYIIYNPEAELLKFEQFYGADK